MVWLVVVSITNLGFGDIVPNSIGGRIFVGVASILGYEYEIFETRPKNLRESKKSLLIQHDRSSYSLVAYIMMLLRGTKKTQFIFPLSLALFFI